METLDLNDRELRSHAYLTCRRLNREPISVSPAEAAACLTAIALANPTRRDWFPGPRGDVYEITLKRFRKPDGEVRWALMYWDGRELTVTDGPTRYGVEYRYEEMRELLGAWLAGE